MGTVIWFNSIFCQHRWVKFRLARIHGHDMKGRAFILWLHNYRNLHDIGMAHLISTPNLWKKKVWDFSNISSTCTNCVSLLDDIYNLIITKKQMVMKIFAVSETRLYRDLNNDPYKNTGWKMWETGTQFILYR